jgi:DUF971 family protein
MSHEGIRFVTEEEARQAQQYKELPREAVEPAKVKVHKTEGTGMEIEWKDGHRSAWNFAWLRNACPCATCHEEREHSGRQPGDAKPKPATVTPVGRYAISFHWNDGHSSGIYSWDFLRRHCTCEECRR